MTGDLSPSAIALQTGPRADFQEQSANVLISGPADDLAVENRVLQSEMQRLENEETALAMELRAWREGHQSLCHEMLRMAGELAAFRQRVQVLENTVATLNEERDSWEREASELRDQIQEDRKRISAVEVESQVLNAERDLLRQQVLELQKQQLVQAAELGTNESKIQQLLEEREHAGGRISDLTDLLHSAERKNRNLVESWSWRLTRPLRWIGQLIP